MADIFISYSRKDARHAEQLADILSDAGFTCWIDRSGIELATSWSGEIVDAIGQCYAFIVLLSSNSIESHNVIKEVSLASEQRKKILPLDLEPVALTRDFAYQLARIQRAPMTDFDSILRALGKLGMDATRAPQIAPSLQPFDNRKSLMILPFEDLSPTKDNAWFADGIVSELISALSNVKALRLADRQATKEFKQYRGQLAVYAKETGIRYFVEGDMRKYGDRIKIDVRLLDIESGEHLWQDSLKGTMEDIFDIQEQVAEKVVLGLKLQLDIDEKKKLSERGTDSVEAYELYLKGSEYIDRQTKEGCQLAIRVWSEALAIDPVYANAHAAKGYALATLYRGFVPDATLLVEGLHHIDEALRLKPDLWRAYSPLSLIYLLQGKVDEAETTAQRYVAHAPNDFASHFALGFVYHNSNQSAKAIPAFEEACRLAPRQLGSLHNLILSCRAAMEKEKVKQWAEAAIPIFEHHLKLFPDNEAARGAHADFLHQAGRIDEAREAAQKLENLTDGLALYNAAYLQRTLGDYPSSFRTFRKSLDAGFRGMWHIRPFLTEEDGLGKFKGTPEWEELREMIDKIEAEVSSTA